QMNVTHGEPQIPPQVLQERHVAPGAADTARLARRHLAEERLVDRIGAMGDRGDLDQKARPRRAHVARVLAEWPFVLAYAGRHEALDHDLGVRRDLEVVRLTLHDL